MGKWEIQSKIREFQTKTRENQTKIGEILTKNSKKFKNSEIQKKIGLNFIIGLPGFWFGFRRF
jgi:hypothetical protein